MRNEFLNKLQKDVENIRSSKNMLVFADKSTNIYEVSREHYEKLLHDSITQTYKRAIPGTKRKIDKESKQFAEHLGTICRTSRNLQNISEFAEHLGICRASRNLQNISELLIEWNVTLTTMHL